MEGSCSSDPVKALVTIRHLIAASTESERKKKQKQPPRPLILRSVPFKWKKTRKNTEEEKQKQKHTNVMERNDDSEEEDSDEFSDALSHAEACSLTMVSDINTAEEEEEEEEEEEDSSHSAEEETRNFMMERFLPAATAMAHPHPHPHPPPSRPPVKASTERRPLPRQSRPLHLSKCRSRSEDEEEEEGNMQLKLACGGFFSWRLKNTRTNPLSFLSPRKKPNTTVYKDEDDDTSSGTDEETSVITATRRKAWEARYKQQKLFTGDHDHGGLFNTNISPTHHHLKHYYTSCDGDGNGISACVLPPPLPKSPSESWLWRAIPVLNNYSSAIPMKAERQDFDDAKWEI